MLPDPPPRPTRPYPAPPEERTDYLTTSYALVLFTLGTMIGLLALLGRVAQEAQHAVLIGVTQGGRWGKMGSTGHSTLLPMIHSLDDPSVQLIALGFALCGIGIIVGAWVWRANGKPATPREWRWTWTGVWIVLWLGIGMWSALFVGESSTRITLLDVSLVLALAGFVALVLMVVSYSLKRPPP